MVQDRQLMEQACRGDSDALCQLYEAYKEDLLTIAACLLGDTAAAEDCLHDMFVAFAGNLRTVRITHSVKGYLVRSIINRARDELRRRARQAVSAAEVPEPARATPEPAFDTEDAERAFRALAVLPAEQREVIALHLQGEMTFREIADLQSESINTIQSRYRYGIEKLRLTLAAGVRS